METWFQVYQKGLARGSPAKMPATDAPARMLG